MLSNADVLKFDLNRISSIYEKWPEHFASALNLGIELNHEPEFYDSIILCGMGASGTACEIVAEVLHNYGKIPVTVLKGQSIPSFVTDHSLVVINSVSGNTREALDTFDAAVGRKSEIVCVSAGGLLKEKATSKGCKHLNIPNLGLPRASLPYLIMPELVLIDQFLSTSFYEEILSIPTILSEIGRRSSLEISETENYAKQLAIALNNSIVFCFASPALISVATRFKNSLNENAKIHCFRDSVLEASHNEIVPFTFPKTIPLQSLLLRWDQDSDIVKERFESMKRLFLHINQPFQELRIPGKGLISAILSYIYILDYATLYLAVLRGIDPAPTPAIDILKKG